MKIVKLLVLLIVLSLCGCGKPVPAEKAAYVGEWEEKTMYLLITQDGSVSYRWIKGGVTTTIDAPLKRFAGDDFEVGIGPLNTMFKVSKPPYQDGGQWKMVVDGVELRRIDVDGRRGRAGQGA